MNFSGPLKKTTARRLGFLLIFLSLCLSIVTISLMPTVYVEAAGLVPCGDTTEAANQCDICYFVELISNVVKFVIVYLAAPIATILIAWAGFKMILNAENAGERGKAKKLLWDIVVGFIFIVLAWQIVILVVSALIKDRSSVDTSWFVIKCSRPSGNVNMSLNPLSSEGSTVVVGGSTQGGELKQGDAYNQLAAGGIKIESTGGCDNPSSPNCTATQGMRQATVDAAVAMQKACVATNSSCQLFMTGGTEIGHSTASVDSHSNGGSFDASSKNKAFNDYIQSLVQSQVGSGAIVPNKVYFLDIGGQQVNVMYETVNSSRTISPHYHISVPTTKK